MIFTFKETDNLKATLAGTDGFKAEFDSIIANDNYHGGYEFIPSAQEQTIRTAGLVLSEDIKIKPIPNNYGLIAWDGVNITVS